MGIHSTCLYLNGEKTKFIFQLHVTVKFLNFRPQENFAVIYLKFKQRGQTLRVFCQNGANGIANSGDPDQTAP